MKKLIIPILLFLSFNLLGQNPGRFPYKAIIQYYAGDTVKTQIQDDTVRYTTDQNAYKFDKDIIANGVKLGAGGSSSADSLKFLTTYSAAQTYLKIVDTTKLHNQITAKQPQLSGTGFVKASGTTITYDNSTYQPAGSYVLSSDTANYISKSQARKDINDSITPLREDIRTLQAENFLGYYPIQPNDTLKISVGNIFTDDGIFISRFVLKDSLGHKHLGENLNILSDINAIYIDYGKNITSASINFSQSFEIGIDLETIYWVIINRNSYRLFLKYFKNSITNQL